MRFENRTAIVTGGATGIGQAVALRLAQEGARVTVADMDLEGAEETAAAIVQAGGQALALQVNVTDKEQVENMVEQTMTQFGGVDILFPGAGNIRVAMFHKMTDEDWYSVIDVHLNGTYLCIRSVINHMREKAYGRIITVTSPQGVDGGIGQANYCAAKAGIIGLTKAIARENAQKGITINAICPVAATRMTEKIRTDPKLREQFLANIPMGRWAEPEEVAGMVAFLASDEAAYMTGQVIGFNGGRTMAS